MDITERRHLEDTDKAPPRGGELLDTSEYAQNIVSTVREPLVVLDDEFRVVSANRSFYSAFHVTPETSEHTLLFDLGNGQWEIPKLRELLEEVLPKSTTVEDFEVEHDFPAIGQKTMLMNARRIQSKTGATPMILLAIEDITERRRVEEALQRVNSELEGYAHTASHDLKGPIGAVSLVFEMLNSAIEKGEVPQEKAEWLKEMIEAGQKSTSNANNLIKNLLVLAEAGEPQDVSTVSIEETIDRVLEENAEMIKEKGITVEVVSPLGTVVANPTHMYQLFSNLIRNSIKHGENENLVIEISSLGVDGTTHRFLVRDNGQGIPEEVLDDVFTPFVKAGSQGSGIGLSIVEKIVKAYGGEIRAYNNGGACFEFKLRDWEPKETA